MSELSIIYAPTVFCIAKRRLYLYIWSADSNFEVTTFIEEDLKIILASPSEDLWPKHSLESIGFLAMAHKMVII